MSDETTRENTPGPDNQPAPRGPWRWGRIVLVISLALNVLFIGFAASRAYQFSGKHWRGHSPVAQVMKQGRTFVRELPRERRRELWAMIKERRGEFAVNGDEFRTVVENLAEALQQDPYDAGLTEQALMKLQGQAQVMMDRGRDVTLEVIAALTPQERKAFARQLLSKTD